MRENMEDGCIPADDWIPVILSMLDEGKQAKLSPHGYSMYPYIVSDRDEVLLKKPNREYKRGDIVLYRRDTGLYVLHRIHHINKKKKEFYLLGDSQTKIEGPLRKEQLLAIATTIIRNKKEISVESLWYKISFHLWFALRMFRRPIIKLWRWTKKVNHQEKK